MRRLSARNLGTVSLAAIAMAVALPASALAQEQPDQEDAADTQAADEDASQADSTQDDGAIVVTGSRLHRDERNSADPLTVINPNQEALVGRVDTAEVLQTSTIAQGSTQVTSTLSSNYVINGGEGVQTVSLRGLGSNRTLVLINGRRAGPAGTRGGVSSFDLNTFPTSAIETIDILKTGASPIYGSDAIAGVVNLTTRNDIDGLDMRGFVSIPEEGGGEQYNISAVFGTRLGDRGRITIGADYFRFQELNRGDRDRLGCDEEYLFNEDGQRVDPIDPRTGQPYCGSFLVDAIGITDYAEALGEETNLVRNGRDITLLQYDRPGSRLSEFIDPLDAPTNPSALSAPDSFLPVGNYSAQSLALTNWYDPRINHDSVIPRTERYTLFGQGRYEITPDIEIFAEGLYNHRETYTNASRELFFNQFTGNSVLPFFFCDDVTCSTSAPGDPLNTEFSGDQLLQPIIYAPFDSSTNVDYYRGVIGAHASLDHVLPNGFVDFYYQYSRSDGDYSRQIIYRDAIDFGVAELRTDLCAGTNTAIRGVPCIDIDYTDPRVLNGDFTDAERAFLFGVDSGNTLYQQNVAELTAGGDLFSLPAGPVRFAIGAQWRRDSIRDVPGEASQEGNVYGSSSAGITAGRQRSLEAFGEVEIPLLRDLPLIRRLTVGAAARLTSTRAVRASDGASDSDTGNWTYKFNANWEVTDWLRFRGTYGTSFRSPALFEQFLADELGFQQQTAIDPCVRLDDRLEAGEVSQRTYDNCTAQGVPGNYLGDGTGSAEVFSTGGLGRLDPETSTAWTASVIFTPRGWLWRGGRFSLTVDYIDIDVRNQVTQLGPQNIIRGCYGSQSFPNDPLCDLFVRDLDPNSPDYLGIISVNDPYVNIDQQRNKSIDVTTRFQQDLGQLGSLSFVGQFTYQLKDRFTLFEGITQTFNGEAGDPKWIADMDLTWRINRYTFTYGLNIIDGTSDNRDQLDDFGTLCPSSGIRGGPVCPVITLPRVAYHSLSANVQVNDRFDITFGVSNLFNRQPPRTSTVATTIQVFANVPTAGTYYDYLGRRFFAVAHVRF